MAKTAPRTLSGFMELLPGQQQQFERILKTLRETYSLYGFTPLDGEADLSLHQGRQRPLPPL